MTRSNPPDMATMSDDDERRDVIYYGATSVNTDHWDRAHVFPEHREPRGIAGYILIAAAVVAVVAIVVWYGMALNDALQVGRDVRGWK